MRAKRMRMENTHAAKINKITSDNEACCYRALCSALPNRYEHMPSTRALARSKHYSLVNLYI